VHVEHAYLNLAAMAFYPTEATEAGRRLGSVADGQTLRLLDLKIEAVERANPSNTPDFIAAKVAVDVDAETKLEVGGNIYVANTAPYVVDVAAADQALGAVNLPNGSYAVFDGILGRAAGVPVDHPLFGYAFAITGTIGPPAVGKERPFVIRGHDGPLFRIDMTASPLTVAGSEATNNFSLNFDYAAWFAGIQATDLAAAGAGALDEASSPALLSVLEKNLTASLLAYSANGAGGDSSGSTCPGKASMTGSTRPANGQ
jgi:hypothetical protein